MSKKLFLLVIIFALLPLVVGSCAAKNGTSNNTNGDDDADGDDDNDEDDDDDNDNNNDNDDNDNDNNDNNDNNDDNNDDDDFAPKLIDNMDDGDSQIADHEGRDGYWYTYNDNDEDDTDKETRGEQWPDPEKDFEMTEGGPDDSKYHAMTKGGGFVIWGSAMGFDLNNPTGDKKPFDASEYKGIKLMAKGDNPIRVDFVTTDTAEVQWGGTCEEYCNDSHGKILYLTDEWTQYYVRFEDAWQQGWGRPEDFDKSKIMSIIFNFPNELVPRDFNYAVDEIYFYTEDEDDGDDDDDDGEGTNDGIDDYESISGFRASRYGIIPFPEGEYWTDVSLQMGEFMGGTPGGVWIDGEVATETTNFHAGACKLTFPNPGVKPDDLVFDALYDRNERTLSMFDDNGIKVWLQIEPGFSDIPILIGLILDRYSHHECVIGFGIDVEWNQSDNPNDGLPVENQEADDWLGQIRSYNENYTLLLKHWDENWMPDRRENLFFLDDSQGMGSLDGCVSEFQNWGYTFDESTVGFQIGYEEDEDWWGDLDGFPPDTWGNVLLDEISNDKGTFWVDFTLYDVFPPHKYRAEHEVEHFGYPAPRYR